MRKIPVKMREELSVDPFMKNCCIGNLLCEGKIDFHHVWIYASRQINEKWAIVPACQYHHKLAHSPPIKRLFEIHSLRRATEEDLKKYYKKNWQQIKRSLQTSLWK